MPDEIPQQDYPELTAIFDLPPGATDSLEDIQGAHLTFLSKTIKNNTSFGTFPSPFASEEHRNNNKKVEMALQACVEYLKKTPSSYEDIRNKAGEVITSVIDETDHALTYLASYMRGNLKDRKQNEYLLGRIYQKIVGGDMSPQRFEVALDFFINHAPSYPELIAGLISAPFNKEENLPDAIRQILYEKIASDIDNYFQRETLKVKGPDLFRKNDLDARHMIERFKLAGCMNDEEWMGENAEYICGLAEDQDNKYALIAAAKVGAMLSRGIARKLTIPTLQKIAENPDSHMREYASYMLDNLVNDGSRHTSLITKDKLKLYGTVGLEIEFYGLEGERTRLLRPAIYSSQGGGWKRRADSTIIPDDKTPGIELVSGILGGKDIKDAYHVLGLIQAMGGKTNKTCGMHVHLGLRNRFPDEEKRLQVGKEFALIYIEEEPRIDKTLRNNSPHARGFNELVAYRKGHGKPDYDTDTLKNDIREAKSMDELKLILNPDGKKYWKLNLQSFERHGTLESRHHDGTVSANEIISWTLLLDRMMECARHRASGKVKPEAEREMGRIFTLFENAHFFYPKDRTPAKRRNLASLAASERNPSIQK